MSISPPSRRIDRIPLLKLPQSVIDQTFPREDGRVYSLNSFPKLRFAAEAAFTLIAARTLDLPEGEKEAGTPIHRDEFLSLGIARDSFFPALRLLIQHGVIRQTKAPYCFKNEHTFRERWYTLTTPESQLEADGNRFIEITLQECAPKPPPGWKLDTRRASQIIAQGVKDGTISCSSAWYGRRRITGSYFETASDYGRVFTQYNGILKECRAALLFNGEATAEVDIANSQMVCLALLLRREGLNTEDTGRFIELAEVGRLYETFAGWLSRRRYMESARELTKDSRKPSDDTDRGVAKAIWNQAVFGKSLRNPHIRWFWAFLREEFPTVTEFIRSLKEGKSCKDARAALSRTLQAVEAGIVLPICHSLNAVSIHDGIRCPVELVSEVTERIRSAFKTGGVSVTIKTELPA